MRRSLVHFWQIHVAVLLGIAVATAVLTGAFLVGDSVRGSLKALSLGRLGKIDHALLSERFFRLSLARDLQNATRFQADFTSAVSAISLQGTAVHAKSSTRASRVQIQGIDNRFSDLFDQTISLEKTGPFPSIIVNEALQKELNAQIGDALLLSFERPSDIHRESLFGQNDVSDALQTMRLTLTAVLPDKDMGRFGLFAHQTVPLNAFVSLPIIQRALGQPDRVNMLLISGNPDASSNLQLALSSIATPDDLGLVIRQETDHVAIESTQFILKPHLVNTIQKIAEESQAPTLPILTYMANTTQIGTREFPYSTITAMDANPVGSLQLTTGSPAPSLNENEIFLNAWAAEDLKAQIGDEVKISYFEVGPKEELHTRWSTFQLKGIVTMSGLGADQKLSPDFPGLQDADDLSDWDAPFPVDLNQVRTTDEDYWDTYRDAPKAFVSAATGQRLWKSRFGDLTAIRVGAIPGQSIEITATQLQTGLLKRVSPTSVGLAFQPVKQQGLAASSGATDFSGLFIGFSQFLIVSSALLVGLLFRLGVEQRSGEIGILMVSGYTTKKIRRQFLAEGFALACSGGVLGVLGGILYAQLMMTGLSTWWVAAVGTSDLSLHIQPTSLIAGYIVSLLVIMFAIWRTVRRLSQIPIRSLLANVIEIVEYKSVALKDLEYLPSKLRFLLTAFSIFSKLMENLAKTIGWKPKQRTAEYALSSFILATGGLVAALTVNPATATGLFFGSGALWLVFGLCLLSLWFRSNPSKVQKSIVSMGVQNSRRQPGRSLLCLALIGCASFVIVTVGAFRQTDLTQIAAVERTSGTGGFALVAETDLPIYHDINSSDGQFALGFSKRDADQLQHAQFTSLRALPGEDVSCLNLYKPESPRILGIPQSLVERGGFTFQQTLTETEEPWALLSQEIEPGVIPAVGDFNSVMWILHKQLGDDILLQNEAGETIRLRLVGLLKTSIFQSELLISESNFLKHFPDQSGYSTLLIETQNPVEITELLESKLKDIGLDATSTTQKLAHFQAVENTYLSTFQTLGGLGLLLGTLGLGIVLLRNVIERRGELAVLRAFGFRRIILSRMLLAENGFLMFIGLCIGTLSALIAVAPHIISHGAFIPWPSLAFTLIVIYSAGLIASATAVSFALRAPLLPALKQEI